MNVELLLLAWCQELNDAVPSSSSACSLPGTHHDVIDDALSESSSMKCVSIAASLLLLCTAMLLNFCLEIFLSKENFKMYTPTKSDDMYACTCVWSDH